MTLRAAVLGDEIALKKPGEAGECDDVPQQQHRLSLIKNPMMALHYSQHTLNLKVEADETLQGALHPRFWAKRPMNPKLHRGLYQQPPVAQIPTLSRYPTKHIEVMHLNFFFYLFLLFNTSPLNLARSIPPYYPLPTS